MGLKLSKSRKFKRPKIDKRNSIIASIKQINDTLDIVLISLLTIYITGIKNNIVIKNLGV